MRSAKNSIYYSKKHPQSFETSLACLPLLISVPHGGYSIPANIKPFFNLDLKDIFHDSDPCTRQIYSFKDEVYSYHDSNIARVAVDLNRDAADLPPCNPDGVVKSLTIQNKRVYREWQQLPYWKTQHLLEKYYFPYHRQIAKDMEEPALLCGLDCHSMLEFQPVSDHDAGRERPFICLSNCGDENGDGESTSCTPDLIQLFAECIREQFPEEAENIVLNSPFKGGHITRFHSKKIPWIQIELNRRAYLQPPWFDPRNCLVDSQRLKYLRNTFLQAFTIFCDKAKKIN